MRSMPKKIQVKFEEFVQDNLSNSGNQPEQLTEDASIAMPQGEENNGLTENMARNSPKKHKRGDQISVNGCIRHFLKYTAAGLGGNVIL